VRDSPDELTGHAAPVRRRWRRRVVVGLLLALPLLAPAGLWVAGMVVANREVRRVIAGAKARGEPFGPQDFHAARDAAEPPNAVPLLVGADTAAALTASDQKLGNAILNGTTGPATPAQLRPMLQKNRAALDLPRRLVQALPAVRRHVRRHRHVL
jgi:hypothetical protein